MPTATDPEDSQPWSETDYTAVLKRLKTLQDHLTDLRVDIPDLVTTFTHSYVSPAELFHTFERVAFAAVKSVKEFRAAWESEETSRVLEKARASRAENDEDGFVDVPSWEWDFVMADEARVDGRTEMLEAHDEGRGARGGIEMKEESAS